MAPSRHGADPLAERTDMEIWVSALAATLTTAAFVPQALHIIRYKETKAISLVMYVAFATGVAFWLWFGYLIWNWPVMISNGITLMLALAIIGMKLKYG
jgi:MtN3 and saliva related transmembrane protein